MRKKLVAGNWKLNFHSSEAEAFIRDMKVRLNSEKVEVVVCVPYISLQSVIREVAGTHIKVGAQNMHYMDKGAYTGEVSGKMLADIGCSHVIIGHSERRERFGETDLTVNLKTLKALECGLTPIVCVGESQKQNREKRTDAVLRKQLTFALDEVKDVSRVVIAYEPIWAIGTGVTATEEQAEEACSLIRRRIAELYGWEAADKVRILYGGSVTAANAGELFKMPNIDGGLVGGESVKPSFEKVVHFE